MPITWENINAPSFGAANILSTSASNRISDGISQLQSLAEQQGRRAQEERDQQKADNTDSVLNDIYALDSMEAYNAAMEGGQFSADTLTGMYGKDVDLNKIRNALMQQDNTIMEDETTAYNYQKTLDSRHDTPIMDDFLTQLYQAETTKEVDALLDTVKDLNISESASLSLSKEGGTRKQTLLDNAYQERLRNQNAWEFGRKVHEANLTDKQRHVNDYNPEKTRVLENGKSETYYPKLEIQTELSTLPDEIEQLPSKYSLPEDYEDIFKFGQGTDAIREFAGQLNSSDVDVAAVSTVLNEAINDTFTIKEFDDAGNVVAEREYTGENLPKWVVKQALQEVYLDSPHLLNFTDWGKRDLSTLDIPILGDVSDKSKFVDVIKKKIGTFETLRKNKAKMDAEKEILTKRLITAQVNAIKLQQEAEEDYKRTKSKKKSL